MGCPGCKQVRVGGKARNHTGVCRARIRGELEKTEEGRKRLQEAGARQTETMAANIAEGENPELEAEGTPESQSANPFPEPMAAGTSAPDPVTEGIPGAAQAAATPMPNADADLDQGVQAASSRMSA